jgi:hypothetical protein
LCTKQRAAASGKRWCGYGPRGWKISDIKDGPVWHAHLVQVAWSVRSMISRASRGTGA